MPPTFPNDFLRVFANTAYEYKTNQFARSSQKCDLTINIVGTTADGLINGPPAATITSQLTDPQLVINFPMLSQLDYIYKFRIEGKSTGGPT